VNDMVRVKATLAGYKTRLIGLIVRASITPGECQDRHHAGLHS